MAEITPINMEMIYMIESAMDPNKINHTSGARGIGQITPIALEDWNNLNPQTKYTSEDLFDETINRKISSWYMNTRIPQMLSEKGVPDTVDNRLIAYNDGAGNASKIFAGVKKIPDQTRDYLMKYDMGASDSYDVQRKLESYGFNPGKIDGKIGPNTIRAYEDYKGANVQTVPSQSQFGLQTLKVPDLQILPAQQERKITGVTEEQQRQSFLR